MDRFDRLYENLILNPYDRISLNELWGCLRSKEEIDRVAAEQVLSDLVSMGYLKPERKAS